MHRHRRVTAQPYFTFPLPARLFSLTERYEFSIRFDFCASGCAFFQWLWFGLIAMGEPTIVVRALTLSPVSLLAMELAKREGHNAAIAPPRKVGK